MRVRGENDLATAVLAEGVTPAAKPGRPKNGNVGDTNIKDRENDATYIVARLKRDDPTLAEQVIAGQITPNAAAIRAGIRWLTIVNAAAELVGTIVPVVDEGQARGEIATAGDNQHSIEGVRDADDLPEPLIDVPAPAFMSKSRQPARLLSAGIPADVTFRDQRPPRRFPCRADGYNCTHRWTMPGAFSATSQVF